MIGNGSKAIVMVDLPDGPSFGGPMSSINSILESDLANKYLFRVAYYKQYFGRFISLKRIFDLKRQIEGVTPDIMHVGGLQLSAFHLVVAARLAGVPKVLITIHGFSGDALDVGWIKRLIMTFIIEPITICMADKFYGVSNYTNARLMAKIFNSKKLKYIYNLPPKAITGPLDTDLRKGLGIGVDHVVAVTVGRITRDKGYHVLARAILEMDPLRRPIFLVVGGGSYLSEMKSELKELVNESRVIFLGVRNDVQEVLSVCDFFVLPTLHETLSIALLEASVQGLPMIASDTGGVPEVVEDGVTGLLVPPGNVLALGDAISILSSDKKMRTRYGQNAKDRISRIFNRTDILSSVDRVYSQLLSTSQ